MVDSFISVALIQLKPDLLFILGLAALLGTVGAKLFQKLHIPQVVGFIVVGILLGKTAFNLIKPELIISLNQFNFFALGIIGFMVGGELKYEVFKKHGGKFLVILLAEGLFAFVLVTFAVTLLADFFLKDFHTSLAIGLVLGAISSATAPAATVDVLWEYKTRGILTKTILAVVALDDGLALLIYGFAAAIAGALLGRDDSGWLNSLVIPLWEIVGGLAVGLVAAVVLIFILRRINDRPKILGFCIASILLVMGLSATLGVEAILAAMVLGTMLVNFMPRRSEGIFKTVEQFSPPVYALFFVFAGARLQVFSSPLWIWALALVYVLGRSIGKISGSWLGAVLSKSPAAVRKYLGICLFSQAGVAIGLSILAGQRFGADIGQTVILVITTTTFIVQIIGPPLVRLGVKKAAEVGLNVTEEDLVKSYHVSDVMDTEPVCIRQDTPLHEILDLFGRTETLYYPVVDSASKIIGVITVPNIKRMFANQKFAPWLLACDVTEHVLDKTTPQKHLEDAIEYMKKYELENMLVVSDTDGDYLIGILDYRKTLRKISAEVLARRQIADGV